MKIVNLTNVDEFFKVVDKCEGRVELVSSEGDRLNLKSKLSQYVSLAKLFMNEKEGIPELEVVAYEPQDTKLLIEFLMEGNGIKEE